MNIIIEGPDGSGKTSVAKKLAEVLGRPYVRCPGGTRLGEIARPYLKDCRQENEIVRANLFATVDYDAHITYQDLSAVYDRCGISGFIYRAAAEEQKALALLRMLVNFDFSFIMPANSMVYLLHAPDHVLDERTKARGTEKDEGSYFGKKVRKIYNELPTCIPRINTADMDVDAIVDRIIEQQKYESILHTQACFIAKSIRDWSTFIQ